MCCLNKSKVSVKFLWYRKSEKLATMFVSKVALDLYIATLKNLSYFILSARW